jgi:ribonucleoside-diphosphate reductase beta chain
METSSFVDELTRNKDKYDPNTICGCLNRIRRMQEKDKTTLSEKYNLDLGTDKIAWVFWKKQEASFWISSEFDYTPLRADYDKASPGVKLGMDLTNGWFAPGDGVVTENVMFRFALESKTFPELVALLTQAKQETIHSETYIKIIQSMIVDPIHRQRVLKYADNLSCVRNKALLMEKYIESDLPKGYRIIAFAASEGIMFWSSFNFIFWLKSQGLFTTVAEINEKISVDEGLHRDYACARYRVLSESEKAPYDHVIKIISEFVNVELEFSNQITSALQKEPNCNYTEDLARKFIHFMANSLLIGLGYEPHWKDAEFPDHMRTISSSIKSNFYEVNVGAYTLISVDKIMDDVLPSDNNNNHTDNYNIDEVEF